MLNDPLRVTNYPLHVMWAEKNITYTTRKKVPKFYDINSISIPHCQS